MIPQQAIWPQPTAKRTPPQPYFGQCCTISYLIRHRKARYTSAAPQGAARKIFENKQLAAGNWQLAKAETFLRPSADSLSIG